MSDPADALKARVSSLRNRLKSIQSRDPKPDKSTLDSIALQLTGLDTTGATIVRGVTLGVLKEEKAEEILNEIEERIAKVERRV